ncbi:hypothetical protein ASG95_09870 [Phycicoccus sp. Soil803]|nr:hypothetical protein ASG95_09870 [Phycicoccus sp. Soil803]
MIELAAAAGLTPADILEGAANTRLALSEELRYKEPDRLARLDREKRAFAERARNGDAMSLLMAFGIPGHTPDWGWPRTKLTDLLADEPDGVLPQMADWLRAPFREWWQERGDEVRRASLALLTA